MSKEVFGPHPTVPLAKAVKANGMLYLSGATGMDPQTGKVPGNDIESQTRQTWDNIKATLESLGSSLEKVVKSTVFLTNIADFSAMNKVYAEYFPSDPPARSTVGVAALAREDLIVEIEVIALP